MRGSRVAAGLLWLVFATLPVRAGDIPYLLADINRAPADPSSIIPSEEPAGFFQLGSRLLFSTAGSRADEGILWSTDGTAAGTVQVSSSLCPQFCQRISPLALWHGIALLQTATGDFGRIFLARTDGTAAGTLLLTGGGTGDPVFAGELLAPPDASVFYFNGCLPSSQCQLWQSDGTRAGTRVVLGADLLPFDNPHSLVARGNRLAFVAYHGPQFIDGLWTTDGTPGGTALLGEISESPDTEARVVATPSHLFFTSGERGEDLWVTDGTPGSARLLADFAPPACHDPTSYYCDTPDVNSLVAEGDTVYFVTYRPGHGAEVWRSDGTVEGTRPLLELPAGLYPETPHRLGVRWIFPVASASQPTALWTAGEGLGQAAPLAGCESGGCPAFHGFLAGPEVGRQLFAGEDAAHGIEIWTTDGTPAGTRRLADACPGPCPGLRLTAELFPFLFPGPPGIAYFHAYPSTEAPDKTGDELWITDGTPGGTYRVAGHAADVGFLDGLTYFGTSHPRRPGSELWATDGKRGGARRVAVLRRFAPGSFPLLEPFLDGALLLPDEGDGNPRLWKSDGTPAGTVPFYDFAPDRTFSGFLDPLGPLQLFAVSRRERDGLLRAEIWRTDGSVHGTGRVIELGRRQGLDLRAVSWAGKLLFDVSGPDGCAYWSSDGTPAGTRRLLPPLPGVRCPTALAGLGSRFLFVARVGKGSYPVPQVFVSDGTPAGTRQVSAVHGSRPPLYDDRPVQAGGTVFFRIFGLDGDAEIWRTDGTPAGTRRAFPLTGVANLYAFHGSLYFTALQPEGHGLFRAALPDGAPTLLAAIDPPGPGYDLPAQLTPAEDRLLFTATDPEHDAEPWVTDGTPAGTHLVGDLQPGFASSNPQGLISAGDRVFFAADDGTHGRELWESDGTAEGTRMVADIAPGGFSALPELFRPVISNGYLFFSADDGNTGLEPWALRLEP